MHVRPCSSRAGCHLDSSCLLFGRILASILFFTCVLPAHAGDFTLRQTLGAIASGEGTPNGILGNSVAIDGDLAVASNLGEFPIPGIIRTYSRNGSTWSYLPGQDIVIPGDSSAQLAFNEGTLFLSAYDSTTSRSYLTIYRRSGSAWVHEYSTSSTVSAYQAVAATDYIAVAGMPGYDGNAGSNQGRVVVLRRTGPGSWSRVFLDPLTPEAGAEFGKSVSIEGGTVVVGAPLENAGQTDAGAAYVFELTIDTWTQVARLVETTAGDHTANKFGTAVAISSAVPGQPDHVVVTTLSNSTSLRKGHLYSYTRGGGTWSQLGPVVQAALATDSFGCAVAMDGLWAIVGACTQDTHGTGSGAVNLVQYTADYSNVVGVNLGSDPQGAANENLGYRVAIDRDGPNIIVGNPLAMRFANPAQGVLLFATVQSLASFALTRQVDLGQGLTGAYASVMAVDGDTLMIGAPGEDVGSQLQRGAVYIYQRSADGTYQIQTRLLAPDGMGSDSFGFRIALQGDIAMISAPGRPFNGEPQGGAVYVFHRDAGVWTLEAQLLPAVSGYEITFGESIALDGDTAVIGEFGVTSTVYQRSASGMWTSMQSIPHRAWVAQIRGDLMMLGDRNVDFGSHNVGEVALYQRVAGTWQPQSTLAGTVLDQGFGADISLDGSLVAITSFESHSPVLVYRQSGSSWLPEVNLLPDDATSDLRCNRASLRNGTLVLGCSKPPYQGAAYVFKKIGGVWSQTQKLELADGFANDSFAGDLAQAADSSIFVGARYRDINFINDGAVYYYTDDTLFSNGFDN